MVLKLTNIYIYFFFGIIYGCDILRAGETDDDDTVCLCIHVGDAKSLLGFINF